MSTIKQRVGLNAPCGAGCFLTRSVRTALRLMFSLNALCGAGCFLTGEEGSGIPADIMS